MHRSRLSISKGGTAVAALSLLKANKKGGQNGHPSKVHSIENQFDWLAVDVAAAFGAASKRLLRSW